MEIGQIAHQLATLAQEGDQQGGGILALLLPLVLLGGVAYFLLIRPQQKRAQQHQRLVSELEPGDQVITIGGMFGEIVEIDEDRVTLEMYDGTQIEFIRTAISRKVAPERDDDVADESDSEAAEKALGEGANPGDEKPEK